MTAVTLLIAVVATLAIFLTTSQGHEILKRIGFRDRVPGAAPTEDVEFLRSACNGDPEEVERRLSIERERYPNLTEADHYRRAIRKVLIERAD